MTPLMLEILLHYHCRADDYRDGDFDAPAVRDGIAYLKQHGMLEAKVNGNMYRTTEKANFYIEQILSLPFPIQKWVMPHAAALREKEANQMSNEKLREIIRKLLNRARALDDCGAGYESWQSDELMAEIAEAEQAPAAPSQEPAVPQSFQPIETIKYWADAYSDLSSGPHFQGHGMVVTMLREYEQLRTILAATPTAPSQEPALHIGACITDGVLHATVMRREANGHVTILAKAEMDAKSLLEHDCVAKLSPAAPSQGPVTDEYAGVIAWVGDKQCKRVITEGAIKHEHTPGVAMRNAAHQCVQEVIITALREKEGK